MAKAATAARTLAEFASGLGYGQIPVAARERARQCIIDTTGAALFGSRLPWSKIVAGHAQHCGGNGNSRVIGTALKVSAPSAALANGVCSHAFELDGLRKPSAGVHPGAILLPAALAVAEERQAGGRELLTAFVAGAEVMFRIGLAAKQTTESLGFHAPGVNGPYGSAIVAGKLLGLSTDQLTQALGIAGSLGGGLLAFAKAGNGAMVKRLHMGRAAEAGVVAALLARDGYEGPDTVLEGQYGYLESYARDGDATQFTKNLGSHFDIVHACLKRYACHITAHTPVQSLQELRAEHGFNGDDVQSLTIHARHKVLSHHDIREPRDVAGAQYSVPFCAAIALYYDVNDPLAFSETALNDAKVRALAIKLKVVEMSDAEKGGAWATRVAIELKDGRKFERFAEEFKGTPASPLSAEELQTKFMRMAGAHPRAAELHAQLAALETIADCRTLAISATS
ncbi:MAG: MmgE/PrpD family protein [Burkholderiales bacterium]|jgi:2-methylcitrate dehydratase PrpD|nr:MmgE/PrpD family protein [Burkholderiales bacterium]